MVDTRTIYVKILSYEKRFENTNEAEGKKKAWISGPESNPRWTKGLEAAKKKGQEKTFSMRKIVLVLIKVYRNLSFVWPKSCIYIPSCSEYAQEAFLTLPFLKALRLSITRIARCNPLSKGGIDPI